MTILNSLEIITMIQRIKIETEDLEVGVLEEGVVQKEVVEDLMVGGVV